jgi:hypothetical protein
METHALVILTILSLCLSPKDAPKVEVPIPEKQPIAEDQFRSYSLEEIAKLDKQIEEAYKNSYNRDRLCSDRSDIYKKLALKKVDPIFRPCISKLLKMTRVPLVFPSIPTVPSFVTDRKHYAYIDGYGIDINKYRVTLTWNILERYQSDVVYVAGEKLTPQFPSLAAIFERDYSYLKSYAARNPERYRRPFLESGAVSLSKGKIGYYIPYTCGAHCHGSYSKVLWEDNGFVYQVGIHMGHKEEIIKLANSTINNQY